MQSLNHPYLTILTDIMTQGEALTRSCWSALSLPVDSQQFVGWRDKTCPARISLNCAESRKASIPSSVVLFFDMQENGLKLSNSWAGYHILLNPDYSAQILWRFVNRAIDEVENHQASLDSAVRRSACSLA